METLATYLLLNFFNLLFADCCCDPGIPRCSISLPSAHSGFLSVCCFVFNLTLGIIEVKHWWVQSELFFFSFEENRSVILNVKVPKLRENQILRQNF